MTNLHRTSILTKLSQVPLSGKPCVTGCVHTTNFKRATASHQTGNVAAQPRFVSLFDMYKMHASKFLFAMEYMGRIGRILMNNEQDTIIADSSSKADIANTLDEIEPFLEGLRVPATKSSILDLRDLVKNDKCIERDLGHGAHQVFMRLNAELGDQWLVILSHEHSEYLNDEASPFGEEIRDKFPAMSEDIDESAKCLALGRYTASVFHMMRVMELAVHVLGNKMRVTIDVRIASWHDITTAVTNALNAMPGRDARARRKKQTYGDVVANLTAVRIAWRNEVMHPKKTYTRKEADRIFNHVEGFLGALANIA